MTLRLLALAFATLVPSAPIAQPAVQTALDGLEYPWDIEVSEDAFYITEKSGTLGTLRNGDFTRLPVITSEPILDDRGGGLLGLALHPDFATNRLVVLYTHHGTPNERWNRVIEARLSDGAWRETRVLIDDIPGHPLYNGGRVAFGPDGMLYITTGWTENRERPQDLDSLAGKILRVRADGSVPTDNPFPGSPVWSLGHRNPQGLAWDDAGRLYAAEHGQSGHDEVNLIEPGGNYGWPLIQGDEEAEGMRAPLAHSGGSTWAPSGLGWDGDRLLVAGLRAEGLLALDPVSREIANGIGIGERIRDVVITRDEILAITTNRSPRREGPSEDRLIRIRR
ncbi:PQQ-dependent sugar dehydrogenase [Allosediminivita pacifica]|uniref:Glucose/arabinose dehydrogenase n=1 Tax=Allosediminivita pacifica TaxID=1267769 RepID=A0A2T6A6D6_9RHOB|nr:PQQ-dependent sugar dehydrogenase [Allosediminivita pacifica]PTX39384.1 glucose/arabinose dehydrogenase [Allosediminivita pacifica]GGB27983.1 dehydrogenase [Allosediminivita pacifica]